MIKDIKRIIKDLNQHDTINIRVATNSQPVAPEIVQAFLVPHRKIQYFFLFVLHGQSTHNIDLQQVTASAGEILFLSPYQIHTVPATINELAYFKITFDETCLSLLPKSYPFLINPSNSQLIKPDESAGKRIKSLFQLLLDLLQEPQLETDLIISYLNALLSEFNKSYFRKDLSPSNSLSKFIQFKLLVEEQLLNHPDIGDIARQMTITTNSLYHIVKSNTGQSPKAYILGRLMLEAQRRLYYNVTTAKELAYDLGFNDPDYFSKLFKKTTGNSITHFMKEIQDLSGI